MSRMRSSYLKPPLPKSPIRLRSRQVMSTLQTPPGLTKLQKPGRRLSDADLKSKLPIEYSSISSEIHALAKMVETEFAEEEDVKARAAASNLEHMAANSAPVFFERGRFYEEYSARRNERLKRKKGGEESLIKATPYNLGDEPITTKRRGATSKKKTTVSVAESTPRYSLRSMSKENKKPPLPLNVAVTAMKAVTTRRARRI